MFFFFSHLTGFAEAYLASGECHPVLPLSASSLFSVCVFPIDDFFILFGREVKIRVSFHSKHYLIISSFVWCLL